MGNTLRQKAFNALISYYILVGLFSGALSLTGLLDSGSGVVLLLILVAYIASLWLARDLISRFTGIRISVWSTVWYVVGVPIVVAFVIFLPLGILLSALFSIDSVLFGSDSAVISVIQYIIANLIFAAVGSWLFVREQKNREKLEAAYAARQAEAAKANKEEGADHASDAPQAKAETPEK